MRIRYALDVYDNGNKVRVLCSVLFCFVVLFLLFFFFFFKQKTAYEM